jgi:hypothetical protein
MAGFLEVTLGGLIGSGIASTVAASILLRRNRTLESEIKRQFDERLKVFESTRIWKESCLSQLLGPAVMQLERTRRAFARWNGKNLFWKRRSFARAMSRFAICCSRKDTCSRPI